MIDLQSPLAGLQNRVPRRCLARVLGAAVALSLLAAYLSFMGRGSIIVVLAASLVVGCSLLVTFDLDRPTRGVIRVPDKPLLALRAEMALPPAASGSENP